MVLIEDLAEAALSGDALRLRSLVQDWLRENPTMATCAAPTSTNATVQSVAAGLVEMFASRLAQLPPTWTASIAGVSEPVFLVAAAKTMPRLRKLCETESPLPLRRRNFFVPPSFLESV